MEVGGIEIFVSGVEGGGGNCWRVVEINACRLVTSVACTPHQIQLLPNHPTNQAIVLDQFDLPNHLQTKAFMPVKHEFLCLKCARSSGKSTGVILGDDHLDTLAIMDNLG